MLEKFNFKGHVIRLEKRDGGDIWASLTDIAKVSGKKVSHWNELKNTQEFIQSFESVIGITATETIQGGQPDKQGTWAIQQVALKFAGWCSVEFEIWMLEQIKTLLNEGTVYLRPKTALELAREQVLLLEDLERKEALIAEQKLLIDLKNRELEAQKPKVEFYEAVRESETNITIATFAKILSNKLNNKFPSMGDVKLFEILRENNFLMSHSKEKDIWNVPFQRYINQGIFVVIEKNYGAEKTLYTQTLITPKGQQYLFKWFTDKYLPKVIDIQDYQKPESEMSLTDHLEEAVRLGFQEG